MTSAKLASLFCLALLFSGRVFADPPTTAPAKTGDIDLAFTEPQSAEPPRKTSPGG